MTRPSGPPVLPLVTVAEYDDQGDGTGDLHLTFDTDMDETWNGLGCLVHKTGMSRSVSVGPVVWADPRHADVVCEDTSVAAGLTQTLDYNAGTGDLKSLGGLAVASFTEFPCPYVPP